MRTIADDILTWSWFSEPHGYNFNGFLISDRTGNLAIDPVEPSEQELNELAQRGVSRILLTNRNHVRAANRVRAITSARTAIHPGDAAHARSQGAVLDDELQVGGKIGPLTVIGVPGKSVGEVAFHWPERRLLIVGDAVVGNPPGRLGLLREKVKSKQGFGGIVGRAPEMEKLYRIIAKAANSVHPVLILGESGTGKEMVARSMMASSVVV